MIKEILKNFRLRSKQTDQSKEVNNQSNAHVLLGKKRMFSVWKIIVAVMLVAGLGVGLTLYFEYTSSALVKFLTIKQQNIDSFINTIFQVQGGVTTLTISILALITGLNKEKKYGILTLDFMMYKNKFMLNFYDEILLSLALLLLNSVFVAFSALAAVEFVLFVSIIIIAHILYCCIKITFFSEKVDKEIREYILSKCRGIVYSENGSKN